MRVVNELTTGFCLVIHYTEYGFSYVLATPDRGLVVRGSHCGAHQIGEREPC